MWSNVDGDCSNGKRGNWSTFLSSQFPSPRFLLTPSREMRCLSG
jgi:hypothetical protein